VRCENSKKKLRNIDKKVTIDSNLFFAPHDLCTSSIYSSTTEYSVSQIEFSRRQ
jgi:hypothetical protein